MLPFFANEPLTEFADSRHNPAYREALARVRGYLGGHRPLVIAREEVDTGQRIVSLNPCKPTEVIGTVSAAAPKQVDLALDAAWRAFPHWAAQPAESRAAVLVKLAGEMRQRKLELAAWETLEAAKNWLEAEADVAEAIDF